VSARPRPPGHRSVLINRISLEMARQRIGENPGGYAWLIVRHKIARLWARTAYVGWSVRTSRVGYLEESIRSAADLYNNLALAAAAVGLLAVVGRRGYAWDVRQILFWAALLTTGVHCIAEVQPRYHHMFLPTIALAVGQLASAGPRPRSRDGGDRPGERRSVGAC